MNKQIIVWPMAGFAMAALLGCNPTTNDPKISTSDNNVATGHFAAALFSGVSYRSGDVSGTINLDGQFQYQSGEEIVFSLGNIELARVDAQAGQQWLLTAHDTRLIDNLGVLNQSLNDTVASGFDVLANQMAFLSALDNDQDASNGFDLGTWSARLATESINFALPYQQFVATELAAFQQRHSLPIGASTHGLAGLYSTEGIAVHNYVERTRTVTKQAPSAGSVIHYEFELNENGQKTREFIQNDNFADGTIDSTETREFQYDADGWQTLYTQSVDSDADGTENRRYEYEYGWTETKKNRFSERREDGNGDARFENNYRIDWDYNEFDQVIMETSVSTRHNPDITIVATSKLVYFYNAQQQLIETSLMRDDDTDGVTDSSTRTYFEYDEQGNQTLRRTATDSYHDGTVDQIYDVIEQYNSDNQLIERRFEDDWDGDGVVNNLQVYRYSYRGDLRTTAETYRDGNNDGVVDWYFLQQYEYDEQGQLVQRTEKYDTNLNGVWDSVASYRYAQTQDESFAVVQTIESSDAGDDGTINAETVTDLQYEREFGLLTLRDGGRDFNMDGSNDTTDVTQWSYGEAMTLDQRKVTTSKADYVETVTTDYLYEAFETPFLIQGLRGDRILR